MGFQQRISYKVITTKCQHGDILRKQLLRVSLNDGDRLIGVTRDKFNIAPISNCKLIKRVEIEGIGIGQQFCQLNTCRSNRLRPNRAPGRNVVARSNGKPDTTTSAPATSRVAFLRRKVSVPLKVCCGFLNQANHVLDGCDSLIHDSS